MRRALAGGSAAAYDQKVHALLSQHAYKGAPTVNGGAASAGGDAAAVKALRERIWHAGAEARDPEVKRRFLTRWPRIETFDAWSMKRLFALNPEKKVAGFDETWRCRRAMPRATSSPTASRLPDDDQRNRDRFLHDDIRGRVYDKLGRPLPEDPATLEMGSLTGLSSQAHAHYGLPHLAFSDEPSVLKSTRAASPFPPTVHTFGADFAESYSILARSPRDCPAVSASRSPTPAPPRITSKTSPTKSTPSRSASTTSSSTRRSSRSRRTWRRSAASCARARASSRSASTSSPIITSSPSRSTPSTS